MLNYSRIVKLFGDLRSVQTLLETRINDKELLNAGKKILHTTTQLEQIFNLLLKTDDSGSETPSPNSVNNIKNNYISVDKNNDNASNNNKFPIFSNGSRKSSEFELNDKLFLQDNTNSGTPNESENEFCTITTNINKEDNNDYNNNDKNNYQFPTLRIDCISNNNNNNTESNDDTESGKKNNVNNMTPTFHPAPSLQKPAQKQSHHRSLSLIYNSCSSPSVDQCCFTKNTHPTNYSWNQLPSMNNNNNVKSKKIFTRNFTNNNSHKMVKVNNSNNTDSDSKCKNRDGIKSVKKNKILLLNPQRKHRSSQPIQVIHHLPCLQETLSLNKIEEELPSFNSNENYNSDISSSPSSLTSNGMSPLFPIQSTRSSNAAYNNKHYCNSNKNNHDGVENKKTIYSKSYSDLFVTTKLHDQDKNKNPSSNSNTNGANLSDNVKEKKNHNFNLQQTGNFSFPNDLKKNCNDRNIDYYRKDMEIKYAIRTKELQSTSAVVNKLRDNKYYHPLRVSSPTIDDETHDLSSPECSPHSSSPKQTSLQFPYPYHSHDNQRNNPKQREHRQNSLPSCIFSYNSIVQTQEK